MSARRPGSRGKHVPEKKKKEQERGNAAAENKQNEQEAEEGKDDESKLTLNQRRVQFTAPVVKQIIHPHMGSVLATEPQRTSVPAERMERLQEEYRRWVEEQKHGKEQEDGTKHEEAGADFGQEFEMDEAAILALMKAIGHERCPDDTILSAIRSTMAQLEMAAIKSWEDLQRMYEYFYAPTSVYGEQLRRACARGDVQLAHELICRGCEVECCSGVMMTPLHCCAEYDQASTAELALKYADHGDSSSFVNAKDRYGWTALMTAVNNGAASVVSLVLRHGADVNATNKQGRTVLHVAAAQNRVEICEKLLEAGADVNAKDGNGMTAAHVAAMFGNMAANTLLSSQAQFDVDSPDGLEHAPKEYLAASK